jgi:hypothetical protein
LVQDCLRLHGYFIRDDAGRQPLYVARFARTLARAAPEHVRPKCSVAFAGLRRGIIADFTLPDEGCRENVCRIDKMPNATRL